MERDTRRPVARRRDARGWPVGPGVRPSAGSGATAWLLARLRSRRTAIVVGLLFVVWLVFPGEGLVRRGVAVVPWPNGATIDFAHATLRPWALFLDGMIVRRADGSELVTAERFAVRPSLLGLVTLRSGYPWTFTAHACDGDVELRIDDDGAAQRFDVRWTDVDLARCFGRRGVEPTVSGRASGSAHLGRPRGAERASGTGELVVRDAVWVLPLGRPEDSSVHAAAITTRFGVFPDRLTLDGPHVDGPDLRLHASGAVYLGATMQDADADVHVTLEPLDPMPRELRHRLQDLPRNADGQYEFYLAGPPEALHVEPPDPAPDGG